jgi:hypothetical protein
VCEVDQRDIVAMRHVVDVDDRVRCGDVRQMHEADRSRSVAAHGADQVGPQPVDQLCRCGRAAFAAEGACDGIRPLLLVAERLPGKTFGT